MKIYFKIILQSSSMAYGSPQHFFSRRLLSYQITKQKMIYRSYISLQTPQKSSSEHNVSHIQKGENKNFPHVLCSMFERTATQASDIKQETHCSQYNAPKIMKWAPLGSFQNKHDKSLPPHLSKVSLRSWYKHAILNWTSGPQIETFSKKHQKQDRSR